MKKYKKLVLSHGHGGKDNRLPGAVANGLKEHEVIEEFIKLVEPYLKDSGIDYIIYDDTTSLTANENVNQIVKYHKQQGVDGDIMDITLHINAGGGTGVEVLYNDDDMKQVATIFSEVMAKVLGLRNRGSKYRSDLGFLRGLKGDILPELFFIDNKTDVQAYQKNKKELARVFVETIKLFVDVKTKPTPTTPPSNPNPTKNIIGYVILKGEPLNIRSKDDLTSTIVGKVTEWSAVGVESIEKNTYKLANGKYISKNSKYSTFHELKGSYVLETNQIGIVLFHTDVNIRKQDNLTSPVVGLAKKGTLLRAYNVGLQTIQVGSNHYVTKKTEYTRLIRFA